ncbi:hypothetical protein F5X96DRAFT_672745 [Biscogniauxia mediterranea]|nr:hypothetical protein F5X96DRAFT_672745 [Biscogniauxia mediterranea]
MPSTPLKLYQDPYEDDYFWNGASSAPWGTTHCEAQPHVVAGLVEDMAYDSISLKMAKQEKAPMADIQAVSLERMTYEMDSGDETESVAAESTTSSSQDSVDDNNTFPFLSLPFEIRQEVYRWLHLMTPVKLTQLMPQYPDMVNKAYVLKDVREEEEDKKEEGGSSEAAAVTEEEEDGNGQIEPLQDNPLHPQSLEPLGLFDNPEALHLLNLLMGIPAPEAELPQPAVAPEPAPASSSSSSASPPARARTRTLLPAYRPFCALPTALLQTSRQVYDECRGLPFEANEFVFANWFASGLWAARAAVVLLDGGLAPWQARRMRWVRLELRARDVVAGAHAAEWAELCGVWADGLQGLRLKIVGSKKEAPGPWSLLGPGPAQVGIAEVRDEKGRPQGWIADGLARMRALRCLEVELEVAEWDNRKKVEWCRDLEEVLGESRTGVDGDPASEDTHLAMIDVMVEDDTKDPHSTLADNRRMRPPTGPFRRIGSVNLRLRAKGPRGMIVLT